MNSNALSPTFVAAYASCCRRIVAGGERVYDVAEELMAVIAGGSQELPKLLGEAFNMWADLTDMWEFSGGEARQHSEELMRQAAAEFLALEVAARDLPRWAENWSDRISNDSGFSERSAASDG